MRLTSSDTLRALMQQREFSYTRLARYAGCEKSMVGHLLNKRKSSCSPALAQRIAEALDVPLQVLFVPQIVAKSDDPSRKKEVAA